MSNRTLVRQLAAARDNFCGIGTRAVKLKLNRCGRTCPIGRAFRIALEIEDKSTQAKKYFGEWKARCYEEKHRLIEDLIVIFMQEGWTFGQHESKDFHTSHVVYFHLPGTEQISFHCSLTKPVDPYPGEWDGRVNSTLGKLEAGITAYFNSKQISLF